jgi:hypothetical protein
MKTYKGTRGMYGLTVTVRIDDGDDKLLAAAGKGNLRADQLLGAAGKDNLRGVAWAILADLHDDRFAERWYLLFHWECLVQLPPNDWTLTEDQINSALEIITAGAPDDGVEPDDVVMLADCDVSALQHAAVDRFSEFGAEPPPDAA